MDNFIEDNGNEQFADGQRSRDLRVALDPEYPKTALDSETPRLETLKQDSGEERFRRVQLPDAPDQKRGSSGDGYWFKRNAWRAAVLALLLLAAGAVTPSAWNYLQSYQSTDDAQIDGHIDPLSSRINGTVVRVHVEDDDRVQAGELLVEIDPRDYEIAVAQAKARLELALAQWASARQDYAAALANTREADAANYKAQRDAQRFAVLLDRQVVAQNEYDQYIATARVDAAKVDSYREAAGSALKTIAARGADVDAAKAALDQAVLNLRYTKIYAPANGIVGKRGVELGSRIEPGQTLMFVTETDEIWVTANFKETQLGTHASRPESHHPCRHLRPQLSGLRKESAWRERRSLQPSSFRKRHWQLRKGSPAAARANHVRRGPGSQSSVASRNVGGAQGMAALNAARAATREAPAPNLARSPKPAHNPWAIALTVTMATFMELLDTSISNVSLPHIAGGLGTSYDESTWVLTSYLVANAIILPMSAWLSRVFGRKRYYMMCVALFTTTSLLCGLAPGLGLLIFFRVLQGVGGGGLAPVEQAILVDTFPKEKLGGAFALYSMAIVTAPAIGPPLGGWITDSFSWRWVFFINVPIGLLSLLLSNRLVHDPVEFTEERKAAKRSGKSPD